jgi:Homeodomain-like domain
MHDRAIVSEALRLRDEEGLGPRRVAQRLGISVGTVRDWHTGKLPAHSRHGVGPLCPKCGQDEHSFARFDANYVYLLGLYLGDGTISEHRRRVSKLRIVLDVKYPGIVDECAEAIASTMPSNAVGRVLKPSDCFEVYSYSRSWPSLFPQHGPGKKHGRRIWLADWQQVLAERWPEALVRGLIQSDGHRFINTGRGG